MIKHWSLEVLGKGPFPGGSVVKNLSAMQETPVQSVGQEDPLEEEMATHSGILAWEIPWTEEPGSLHFMESQKSRTWLCNHTTTTDLKNYETKLVMLQVTSGSEQTGSTPCWVVRILVHYCYVTNYSPNLATHNNVHGSGIQLLHWAALAEGFSGSCIQDVSRGWRLDCGQGICFWDGLVTKLSAGGPSSHHTDHLLWLLECPYNVAADPPPPQST